MDRKRNREQAVAVSPAEVAARGKHVLRVVELEPAPVAEASNEGLMLAQARGSTEAFEELVRRHQKGVLNYIYRMIQNRHVAEELTQEVFLALVKNGPRYQPTAKFTTYLYAIASNIVSKEWLRRKRRPKLFSINGLRTNDKDGRDTVNALDFAADERADVETAYKKSEITEAVSDALKHLPDHQRQAFVMRRFQDLSYEEIARIAEVPIGTVKSRVVRAERALRPWLLAFREYVTGVKSE